jgi:hypothetical protein
MNYFRLAKVKNKNAPTRLMRLIATNKPAV